MPSIQDIARTLRAYRGRYEFLDAFVDDINEVRSGALATSATLVEQGPHPKVGLLFEGEPLVAQLFPEQGIARFWLGQAGQQGNGDRIAAGAAAGAAIGGLLGTAVSSATKTKEGLLGGLILGMLVGGVAGAAAQPVERVLAMQFDPAVANWRLYDGPLLRWAKRTLHPAA